MAMKMNAGDSGEVLTMGRLPRSNIQTAGTSSFARVEQPLTMRAESFANIFWLSAYLGLFIVLVPCRSLLTIDPALSIKV